MVTIVLLMIVVRLTGIMLRRSVRNENRIASMRRSYAAWERSRKVRYY